MLRKNSCFSLFFLKKEKVNSNKYLKSTKNFKFNPLKVPNIYTYLQETTFKVYGIFTFCSKRRRHAHTHTHT